MVEGPRFQTGSTHASRHIARVVRDCAEATPPVPNAAGTAVRLACNVTGRVEDFTERTVPDRWQISWRSKRCANAR
jgi:hypothetical protein